MNYNVLRSTIIFFCFILMIGCGTTKIKSNKKSLFIKEIYRIGVDEAVGNEQVPYEFGNVYNNYCDFDLQGRVYVLDSGKCCVRVFDPKGKFLEQYFSKGEGPQELSHPIGLAMNRFRGTLFVLQQFGFSCKEFTLDGKLIKNYNISEQIQNQFLFLNRDECVHFSLNIGSTGQYNLKITNLETKKNRMDMSFSQLDDAFAYFSSILYSQKMIYSFIMDKSVMIKINLVTGRNTYQSFGHPLKQPQLLEVVNWRGYFAHQYVQPCSIGNSIGLIVSDQEFENTSDMNSLNAPRTIRHSLYFLNKNRFELLGPIPQADDFAFAKIQHGNRLLFSRYYPFSQILCLEITLDG